MELLNKRYRVLGQKQGGMGVVYICEDTVNNDLVALKTYLSDIEIEDTKDLFIREAKAWKKVGKGEFILSPKEIILISGRPFIVLPYCKNGSLNPGDRDCDQRIQPCKQSGFAHIGVLLVFINNGPQHRFLD